MKRSFILLLVLLLSFSMSIAQNTKRADKAYEGGEYYKAVEEYTLLQDQVTDPATKSLIRFRIADSYRKMNRPDKAEKFYVDAIKAGYMSPEVYLGYGSVLLSLAKYDEAKQALQTYKRSNPMDQYVDALLASCDYAKNNQMVNPNFVLQPLEAINTRGSEFGIAYFNDALIYASTGSPTDQATTDGKKKASNEISLRTGLGYSKFYMSVPIGGNYNKGDEALGLNVKGKMNQGTFSYDPSGGLGYYTRCEGRDNNCYIYFAEFKGNQWKEKDRLLVESRKMPIGHPFITPDGRRIYFTSNMEGGYGKADLWYMDKLPDGSWSKPINLGREVNTVGNEVFPFVAGGYLFFASDGHPGYGSLDLFASKIDGNVHGEAFNLGLPFNSSYDDFNLIERLDLEEGMLVSGRRNEKSSDDIFKYKGFPSSLIAYGRLYDSVNNEGLKDIPVEVTQDGKTVEKLTTNDSGYYNFYLAPGTEYKLSSVPLGYNPVEKSYTAPDERFGRVTDWNLIVTSSEAYISGIVTHFEEKNGVRKDLGPLAGAKVILLENGRQVKVVVSKANGEYRFGDIKENTQYMIQGLMPEHLRETKTLPVGKITRSIDFCRATGHDMDIALQVISKEEIRIDNIYYDFGKFTLRPESLMELDKLVAMLNKNPQLKIQINSHTDNKGSHTVNDRLSNNRAKSVVDYLISKGISPLRLTAKGHGKRKLLIDKKRTTEAEDQQNRRTTFNIVGETGEAGYDTSMQISESVEVGRRPISLSGGGGSSSPGQVMPSQPVAPSGGNEENMPYRIQIVASRSLDMSNPAFSAITTRFNMKVYAEQSGGWYRYFVGGFNTKAEADQMANTINRALGTSYFSRAK